MPLKLYLHNPSDNWRKGYVKTPWQPIHEQTGISPDLVAVFDAEGNQLDTQVHQVDPDDPSRDVLVFWLDREIRPGFGSDSTVSATATVGEREHEPRGPKLSCEIEGDDYRARLYNGRLALLFELAPVPPWKDAGDFYAGSATTVLLEQESAEHIWTKDILDAFDAIEWHDLEKRCMQVDRIRLSLPAWASEHDARLNPIFSPIRKPYKLLSRSEGPVRASIGIASSPFHFEYPVSPGKYRKLSFSLYRVVSLYREANFVIDELHARGTLDGEDGPIAVTLFFNARYFMQINLGLDASPSTYFRIWDWFGISGSGVYAPNPAFGFATDAHCSPVVQYPADYPYPEKGYKAFRWELERADVASCVHLFSRHCNAEMIESHAGKAWYEYVYRPLWAEVAAGTPARASISRRTR